jgi:hypothetical protein
VNEPTSVEARFSPDGDITLVSFTWQGHTQPVTSMGRQWKADDGRHFLVMIRGDRIFELRYQPDTQQWRVVGVPTSRLRA